jgi:prevent-host-death family protein
LPGSAYFNFSVNSRWSAWATEVDIQARILYNLMHVLCLTGDAMGISATDVIPLSQARANFSELAEEVKAGAEKIVTKNGESYIALIDAHRLDYYHKLERERIHLLLIDEVSKGLDDVAAGRVKDARGAILAIKRRRKA